MTRVTVAQAWANGNMEVPNEAAVALLPVRSLKAELAELYAEAQAAAAAAAAGRKSSDLASRPSSRASSPAAADTVSTGAARAYIADGPMSRRRSIFGVQAAQMPVAVRVREALALARRAEHTIAIAADHEATVLNAAAGRPLAEARASTDPRTGIVRHAKAMQTLVHPLPRADFLRHAESASPVLLTGGKLFLARTQYARSASPPPAVDRDGRRGDARRQQADASSPRPPLAAGSAASRTAVLRWSAAASPMLTSGSADTVAAAMTCPQGGLGHSRGDDVSGVSGVSGGTTARSLGSAAPRQNAALHLAARLSSSAASAMATMPLPPAGSSSLAAATSAASAGGSSSPAPRTPPAAPQAAIHAHAPRRQGLRRTYVPALHDTPPQAAGTAARDASADAKQRLAGDAARATRSEASGTASSNGSAAASPSLVPSDLLDRRSAALLASHRVLFLPPGQQVDPLALRAASTGPACSPVAERRVSWMMSQVVKSRPVADALHARVAQYARDAADAAAAAAASAGDFIARNASPDTLAAAAPAARDERLRSSAASTAERVAAALAAHERIVAASKAAAEAQLNRGAVLAAAREVLERRMTWATVVVLARAAARWQRVLQVQIAVRTHAPAAVDAATRLQSWWRSLAGVRFYRRLQRALPGLRKALWRWRIFLATQRKARAAAMLRRFAQDFVLHDDPRLASTALCRYMRTWRRSVVRCQRAAKAWLACRAARMELLRLLWSKLVAAQAGAAAAASAAATSSAAGGSGAAAGRRGSLTLAAGGGRRPSTAAEAEGSAARGMRRASRVDIRGLPLPESTSGAAATAPPSAVGPGTVRRSSTAGAASSSATGSGSGSSSGGPVLARQSSARRTSVSGSGAAAGTNAASSSNPATAHSASRRRGSLESVSGAVTSAEAAGNTSASAAASAGTGSGGAATGTALQLLPRNQGNAAIIDDVLRNYLRYRRAQHVQEKAAWLQRVTAALLGRKLAQAANEAGGGTASARAPEAATKQGGSVAAASAGNEPAPEATTAASTARAPVVTGSESFVTAASASAGGSATASLLLAGRRLPPLFLQPAETESHAGDAFSGAAGAAATSKATRAEAGKIRRPGGFAAVVAMAMADAALRNQRSARRRFAADVDGQAHGQAHGAGYGHGFGHGYGNTVRTGDHDSIGGTTSSGTASGSGSAPSGKRHIVAVAKAALNASRTSRVSAGAASAAVAAAAADGITGTAAGAGGRSSARDSAAAATAASDVAAERTASARTALLLDAHAVAAAAGIVIVEPNDPAVLLGHLAVRAALERLRRLAMMQASEERANSSLSRRRVVFGAHVSSTGEAPGGGSGTSSVANLLAGQGSGAAGAMTGGHHREGAGMAASSSSASLAFSSAAATGYRSRTSAAKPSGLRAAALRRMRGRGSAGAGASPSDAAEVMLSAALDSCCPLPMRLLCAPVERSESAREQPTGRSPVSYRERRPAGDADADDPLAVLTRLQGMATEWRRTSTARVAGGSRADLPAGVGAGSSALAGLRLQRVLLSYKPIFSAPAANTSEGGPENKNALLTWAAGGSASRSASRR